MSNLLRPAIVDGIKDLICHITGNKENTEEFKGHEHRVYDVIKKSSDKIYIPSLKDLNDDMDNMIRKFHFHSFHRHADYLRKTYENYLKQFDCNDLTNHLTIIKFLLIMSTSPIENFLQYPERFEFISKRQTDDEDEINWYEYLKEDIDVRTTYSDESSELLETIDEDNYDPTTKQIINEDLHNTISNRPIENQRIIIKEVEELKLCDFSQSRQELLQTVQHTWFNSSKFYEIPYSDHPEATLALRWDEFLQKHSYGLINIEPDNIITEYKVIREIIWQLFGGHNSTIFQFQGDRLRITPNITIASLRQITFTIFLRSFLDYIRIVDDFREFSNSLKITTISYTIPETYRGYSYGIENILRPFMKDVLKLEEKIRQQESTFTLLKFLQFLRDNFESIRILKRVHRQLQLDDFKQTTPIICSLKLLINLHKDLNYCCSKLEQNVKLSLFLESVYYYLKIINDWLVKGDLNDTTQEFVILNKNSNNLNDTQENYPNWCMNFELQSDIVELCNSNSFIKIISNDILQIGRNLHFLRVLGQYTTITDSQETIYESFIKKIFQALYKYYDIEIDFDKEIDLESNHDRRNESLDNLNDYIDTSGGFFMEAFEQFIYERDDEKQENLIIYDLLHDHHTIFYKLNQLPEKLFPIQQTLEDVLKQILTERFIISGLMVKKLLIEKFNLEKLFQFLQHLYLLGDDLIFSFYRRFFETMGRSQKNWGDEIWLVSHLQDIIMDIYPSFYTDIRVKFDTTWRQYPDTYEVCNLIDIEYNIDWPLNIIITIDHMILYKEIFSFLLTLKWALFTLNHLSYSDLAPRKIKNTNVTIKRLMCLRFCLVNVLSSIQHYIFGFVFKEWRNYFELDFEKADNLQTIVTSHSDYINSIYSDIIKIRDCKNGDYGYQTLLVAVNLLKVIWTKTTSSEKIDNCCKLYQKSFDVIYSRINPTFII